MKPTRMSCYFLMAVLSVMVLVFSFPLRAEENSNGQTLVPAHVEVLLLTQDWAAVAKSIEDVDENCSNPVLRLIKAHACLALNRNNEALALFLSDFSEEDLQRWSDWTSKLPSSAVAQYLAGDAAARQKRWDDAIGSFSSALILSPRSGLILNARGVAYAANADWDSAREDFKAAIQAADAPKDAFVNRGTYILQRRTDPERALEYFKEAAEKLPNSVLALNGRACANMLLKKWDEAYADLEAADKLAKKVSLEKLNAIVAMNFARLAQERNKAIENALACLGGIKPGMSIDEKTRIFKSLSPSKQQMALDVLHNAQAWNNRIAGSSLAPSKLKAELGVGIKGSLIGPTAFVEGKVGADWNIKETSRFNLSHQTDLIGRIKEMRPDLKPNKISNFGAFMKQNFGGLGVLTKPGGVSSSEVQADPTDEGAWNVSAIYGLAYPVVRESADTPQGMESSSNTSGKAKEDSHAQTK